MRIRFPLALLATVGLAACGQEAPTESTPVDSPLLSVQGQTGQSYLVLGAANRLPARLDADVAAAGGQVVLRIPEIGVAVVESNAPDFAARAGRIGGVVGVAADQLVQWTDPSTRVVEMDIGEAAHAVGAHETFRAVQWAPDAISAPAAWATGALGAGARVAILDGGIRNTHIDIAPNLDVARSTSFVPGQPYNADVGTFWHGTHVAGIVGAPANNIGTVGIAPAATLIGVKVLHNGSGAFSWVIQGIVYAATPVAEGGAGAHIINMSLGALFPRQGQGAAQLAAALGRATTYAYQRGTTVLAAAGNDGVDLDHTANLIELPAMSPHVIAVAATGPLGFGMGATDYDRPASYTNFGQSAIAFAGPGGDFQLPGNAVCSLPRFPSGTVVQFCWALDMVMAPCRGSLPTSNSSYCWAAGTSMAAPAAAGVAALIVGKYGPMHPAQVETRLRQSADDLGKPGNDDFYGRGRVNAYRAVTQ